MRVKDDEKRLLSTTPVWPDLRKREKQQSPTETKSRVGNSVRGTAQILFLVTVITIFSLNSFAATDVLFLIDSTSSMNGLSNFKTAFSGILDTIADLQCSETLRYGVADYKNYVDGGKYQAYGVNLDQPFTSNAQTAQSAISRLYAGGGGDGPESQLKAMINITSNWLTPSGDLGFNGRSGARKIIIWAGDDPGHVAGESPVGYYPTLAAVIDALTAQGIIVFALNSNTCNSGLNEPYDGVNHNLPPARQQASEITAATGGKLFCNVGSGNSEIEDDIIDAIMCYSFTKDDDLNDENPDDCRSPNQELTYSICFSNDSSQTLQNAYIIDWLPEGVTYPVTYTLDPNTWQMIPSDLNYDPNTHSYIWNLNPIAPNTSACVELTVVVNESARPGMYLHNMAELVIGEDVTARATKDTLVCCWDTNGILYVDKNATGNNTGVSWANAYTDLQDALDRARTTQCTSNYVIYVAQGTYSPDETPEVGFKLPDNISVYGGFPTGGCDFSYRNPKKYITTLTGLIDEDDIPDIETIVTMGNESLLDGFTVCSGYRYNVYGTGVNFTVSHCIIKDGYRYGIYATNSNVTMQWCTVNENGSTGLYHTGDGFTLAVDNSLFMRNGEYGLYTRESTLEIKNSLVSESDRMEQGRAGIRLYRPAHQSKLYNLTVANNRASGIMFEDNADTTGNPNTLDYPDIQNSIFYYNNEGGPQMAGLNPDLVASYCCVQDCNEPAGTTNFNDEPQFVYTVDPNGTPDPNNYHLSVSSPCVNNGNLFLDYSNQVDIDGEGLDRQYGSAVDIGADEVYDCHDDYLSDADVHNDLDWNVDGIVNLVEFNEFSVAWLSHNPEDPAWLADPNLADPNLAAAWNPKCNLNSTGSSTYTIDTADLTVFLNDWLWVACWKLEEINTTAQTESMSVLSQSLMVESVAVENSLPASSLEVSSLESPSLVEETAEEQGDVSAQTLIDILGFLNEVSVTETDNIEGIEELKAILREELRVKLALESDNS